MEWATDPLCENATDLSIPHPTVIISLMHKLFLVTDILRFIFLILREDGRKPVLSLSLVAKVFLDCGMECLWEELHDIRPPFRLLLYKTFEPSEDNSFPDWVSIRDGLSYHWLIHRVLPSHPLRTSNGGGSTITQRKF